MDRLDKIGIILSFIDPESQDPYKACVKITLGVLDDTHIDKIFVQNIRRNLNKISLTEDKYKTALMCLVMFELDNNQATIPKSDVSKIDELIAHFEEKEQYDLCAKLMKYKAKMENV